MSVRFSFIIRDHYLRFGREEEIISALSLIHSLQHSYFDKEKNQAIGSVHMHYDKDSYKYNMNSANNDWIYPRDEKKGIYFYSSRYGNLKDIAIHLEYWTKSNRVLPYFNDELEGMISEGVEFLKEDLKSRSKLKQEDSKCPIDTLYLNWGFRKTREYILEYMDNNKITFLEMLEGDDVLNEDVSKYVNESILKDNPKFSDYINRKNNKDNFIDSLN